MARASKVASKTGDCKTEKLRTYIKIMNPTSKLPTQTSTQYGLGIPSSGKHGAASERGASSSESSDESSAAIHRKGAGKAGVEFSLSRKSTDRRSSNPDDMETTRDELGAIRDLYQELQTKKGSAKTGAELQEGIKAIKFRIRALTLELANKESSMDQRAEDRTDDGDELGATQAVLTELEGCVNALQGKASNLQAKKTELEKAVVKYEKKMENAKAKEKTNEALRRAAGIKKAKEREAAGEHNVSQAFHRTGQLLAAQMHLGLQELVANKDAKKAEAIIGELREQLDEAHRELGERGEKISSLEKDFSKEKTTADAAREKRGATWSEKIEEIKSLKEKIGLLEREIGAMHVTHQSEIEQLKDEANKSRVKAFLQGKETAEKAADQKIGALKKEHEEALAGLDSGHEQIYAKKVENVKTGFAAKMLELLQKVDAIYEAMSPDNPAREALGALVKRT